jgi:hypothetical protein
MENNDTKTNQPDTPGQLPPATSKKKAAKKQTKSSNQPRKTDQQKKKTLRQYWDSATPLRKIEIILATIIAAGGLLYVGVAIVGLFQAKGNFQHEQRPRISAGSYTILDTVTKDYGPNMGHPFAVNIILKNVGKSAAYHVYIHRHVLFGKQYPLLKVEPPDIKKTSIVMEPGSDPIVTSAVSVKDTYTVESTYIAPDAFLPWDGTNPIVVFGRITYEDSFGNVYCTPFGAGYLNGQTFATLSTFSPQDISVSDLCPSGTIP